MTERQFHPEEAIYELKEQYQNLLNDLLVGVYIFQDNIIRFANPKLAEIFGFTVEELVNKMSPLDVVCPDDIPMVQDKIRQRIDGEVASIHYELRGLKKDGSIIYLEGYGSRTDYLGRPAIQGMVQDISERKQAVETLRLSEERFSKAFNAGPNPMAITTIECGQIIEVNYNFLSFFGYFRQEILNRTTTDLNIYDNAEDRAKIIHNLMEQGSVKNIDINFRIKSGEIRMVLLSAEIITLNSEQYLLSVINDITELRHAQESLLLSEERFYRAFYNNPTPMVIVKLNDNKHIEVNKSYERFFGFTREEIIDRTVLDIGLYVDPKEFELFMKLLMAQGYVHNQSVLFKTKFGDIRNVLMSAEIIELNNEKCRLLTLNDITSFKKMEVEMARLERLNLIGQMAGGIGHEIRNPMTTVRGFLQVLGRKDAYSREKEYFNLMIDELDRANSIITSFLSLARNKPIDKMVQNLNQVIKAILPLIQADANESDIVINVELGELPELLLDEKEIKQLFLNLVRNGLEAMSSGGKLDIITFADRDEVILAVKDEGSGIKPQVLEKIGTPFFTTKDNGTGLGLATCYNIAERHNAIINIDTCSTGTTFHVRFKVKTH